MHWCGHTAPLPPGKYPAVCHMLPTPEMAATCTFPLIASAKTKQTQIGLALSSPSGDFAPKQAHMHDWHCISSGALEVVQCVHNHRISLGALAAVQPVQPLHLLAKGVLTPLVHEVSRYRGKQKLQLQF